MPTPLLQRLVPPLLVLLLAVAPASAQGPNRNVRFGMPGPAKADPESREAYLIARDQYVLSYNAKTKTPNWVCWVRHEVADVTVLRSEDRPTAPAVLPAVSYGACVSGNGTCQAPGQRSLLHNEGSRSASRRCDC
jgi:hypothetical protein